MRIIAGQRRGHKIDGPRGSSTRPTSDLVRESIFNILGEAVEGRVVLDLFAGTGALGLEALSRGASRAIFVERNRDNIGLIHRNVATLRYEGQCRVHLADAYRWALTYDPGSDDPVIVVIDPPYRDYEIHQKKVKRLLEHLTSSLPRGSALALESRARLDEDILPEEPLWDVRRYGGTQIAVRFLTSDPPPEAEEAAEGEVEDSGVEDVEDPS
ncbi:16S rRNA (guanine(966)-N(2))-methyltransferase RsmD [Singulisphaera sp. PoT]|uniref:16S rRNA (guanine(966)-N(2))-methyltransferase RsmD n=1 Tax=Singulisphaera sp. PoT TaxID=3411797 RepID=UPI003BF5AE34